MRHVNPIRRAFDSFLTTLAGLYSQRRAGLRRQTAANQHSLTGCLTLVALMSTDDENGRLLVHLGEQNGWRVVFADTVSGARATLNEVSAPVVLCDRKRLGAEWRTAIRTLSARPACVILLSVAVDTYLWNEVVRSGGYDVVPKPLRAEDVIRAVRLARSYCSSPARTGIFLEDSCQAPKGGGL
jgi:DNA-binding response OmpR family regulator